MRHRSNSVRLALPKGRFLSPTADLLNGIALGFEDYDSGTRRYRLQSPRYPFLSAKVLQERDICVQVAVGNYDLGICGSDWIEELQAGYPASTLVRLLGLNYGEGSLYLVASCHSGISDVGDLVGRQGSWRIVSEYSNLTQALTSNLRLRRFRIFPVWGAAGVYLPEDADLAVLWARNEKEVESQGLFPLMELFPVQAFLIANRDQLENKDVSPILDCFGPSTISRPRTVVPGKPSVAARPAASLSQGQEKGVKLALPDGHQKAPTSQFLERAGLKIEGYSGKTSERRLSADLEWLSIKVIRPQDMPLHVANGNFDLAVTGRDWLLEHLYRFPSSPVIELLDLGFGKVKIVAALAQETSVADIADLRALVQAGKLSPLRVASEYVNIADKYLRDNHISSYRLIPTWGASEAFLPEDADLLIDNTQTGKTLAEHNLRVIDVLLRSSACLIGNEHSISSPDKRGKIESVVAMLRRGLE